MCPGMMPILHAPGRDDAGAVRSDEPHRLAFERAAHADHVHDRDALGDADDQPAARVDRLEDRVGRAERRHEDARGVGAGLLDGFRDGVENRNADLLAVRALGLERFAAAVRRAARDDLRAVRDALLGVERARRAGDALDDDLRVLADQNRHRSCSVLLQP